MNTISLHRNPTHRGEFCTVAAKYFNLMLGRSMGLPCAAASENDVQDRRYETMPGEERRLRAVLAASASAVPTVDGLNGVASGLLPARNCSATLGVDGLAH